MSDDVSRADAQRATNDGGTRRRAVLAGITGVVGAALGGTGAAAAAEMAGPDAGGSGARIPTCDPGCSATPYCCEEYDGNCIQYCWYCYC